MFSFKKRSEPLEVVETTKLNKLKYLYLQHQLKRARLAAGMTQVQAGEKIKQPQVFISKIERGKRNVDAIELQEIAAVYGVPIKYFLK